MNASTFLVGSICSGVVAALGITMEAAGNEAVPWDKIGVGGVLASVAAGVAYMHKREQAIRTEHAAAIEKLQREHREALAALAEQHRIAQQNRDAVTQTISKDFSDTTTNLTKTFVEQTKAQNEDAQRREQRQHEIHERLLERLNKG